MTRSEVRSAVQQKLDEMGISTSCIQWVDRPAVLRVLVGAEVREISIRAGMPKYILKHELEKLEAYGAIISTERKRVSESLQLDLEDVIGDVAHG